jgi:hypothetical protein
MEDFFEGIENKQLRDDFLEKVKSGKVAAKANGVNYTTFANSVLLGIKEEYTVDWIVEIYNDYLFDLNRLSSFLLPCDWLKDYVTESWCYDKYLTALEPLKALANKNQTLTHPQKT